MIFFLFLLGLAVGSFLNVLIDRLPRDESIIKGRSYCEHCKKPLIWYDLIPLLSFLILKGKCRYCHFPISWYYSVVELTTGILFVLVYLFFPQEGIMNHELGIMGIVSVIYYLFIVSSFIVVFFADLKYGIIPDKVVFSSIVVSIVYLFILHNSYFIIHLLSALGAFLFFFLLYLITRGQGMGFGDVKLVFLLGLFLGWPKVIVAFYIAFLTGAILGCILILWGKKKFSGGTVPFGPFLVLGAITSLFWGEHILIKIMQAIL